MSFPRYENYKDSGVEWIGDLPNDWKVDKIKFNTYVKGRVGWHGLNSNEFSDEGVHLVTGTDFDNGFVNWDRCYRISEERYSEDPYIQLKENDLLITKDGTIGKLARVKGLPERASLNSGIFLVRAKNKAYLEDYLYWVLQSSLFVHFMDLRKTGSTIQHLYQEVFNQFAFPIPSQSEQHQICIFLDRETAKIDALIAEQQRLMELLKKKRQAVISHAVTKGLNPDAQMKDSGIEWLGEVPAHWAQTPIKHVLNGIIDTEHKTAPFFEDGEYLVVRTTNIKNGKLNLDSAKYTDLEGYLEWTKRGVPEPGDILFTREAPAGEACLVPKDIKLCVGQRTVNMRVNRAMLNSRFGLWSLYGGVSAKFIADLSQGSTVAHFNMSDIGNIPIMLPRIEEQSAIADFLDRETDKLDTLTAEAQRGIELLKERRTALISAAVTGKIDVRSVVSIATPTEAAA
jgi:type I restriction enzyme S subunit